MKSTFGIYIKFDIKAKKLHLKLQNKKNKSNLKMSSSEDGFP